MEEDYITVTLRRGESGLGFNIRGGEDHPHIPEDSGLFVSKIRENGAAAQDGRLREGDKIVELNGKVLGPMQHAEAVNMFIDAGEEVVLKVWPRAESIIKERSQSQAKKTGTCPIHSPYFMLFTAALGVGLISYIVYRKLK